MKIVASASAMRNLEDPDWALRDFHFEADDVSPTLIEGESGSGKTTILRFLMGDESVAADNAVLTYHTTDRALSVNQARAAQSIAYVGTEHPFLNWCSIEKSMLALSKCFGTNIDIESVYDSENLKTLNLSANHLLKKPHQLSFGERRRMSVLFAVSMSPQFIFIDELFNGLDAQNCDLLAQFVIESPQLSKSVIVLTSHEPRNLANRHIRRFRVDPGQIIGDKRVSECRHLGTDAP